MNQKTLAEIVSEIKKRKRTLFVLCGLPYSGKSYFAKQIKKEVDCEYVSIDQILEQLGYDWNTGKLPDTNGWEEVMNIVYSEIQSAVRADKNVLYDSTNHTKTSRDVLRKVAEEVSAPVQIIYIESTPEIVKKRWEENKITRERFVLDEKLLLQTIDALEAPVTEENAWVLKTS